jgi:hypothetical protein
MIGNYLNYACCFGRLLVVIRLSRRQLKGLLIDVLSVEGVDHSESNAQTDAVATVESYALLPSLILSGLGIRQSRLEALAVDAGASALCGR